MLLGIKLALIISVGFLFGLLVWGFSFCFEFCFYIFGSSSEQLWDMIAEQLMMALLRDSHLEIPV